jgi:hypothetical protein
MVLYPNTLQNKKNLEQKECVQNRMLQYFFVLQTLY